MEPSLFRRLDSRKYTPTLSLNHAGQSTSRVPTLSEFSRPQNALTRDDVTPDPRKCLRTPELRPDGRPHPTDRPQAAGAWRGAGSTSQYRVGIGIPSSRDGALAMTAGAPSSVRTATSKAPADDLEGTERPTPQGLGHLPGVVGTGVVGGLPAWRGGHFQNSRVPATRDVLG